MKHGQVLGLGLFPLVLQVFPFLNNPVGVTGGALGWLVHHDTEPSMRTSSATARSSAAQRSRQSA
jgi:hypothetical protein